MEPDVHAEVLIMELLNNTLKIVRYDEGNQNIEAQKGKYGQTANSSYSVTILKNVMFINLYNGASVELKLPAVRDGFLMTSKGRIVEVKDSVLKCALEKEESAFGQLVLQKWN